MGLLINMIAEWCATLTREALKWANPEIFNGRGERHRSRKPIYLIRLLRKRDHHTKMSGFGKGRAIENIFIERFWRTVKFEDIRSIPLGDDMNYTKGWKNICIFTRMKDLICLLINYLSQNLQN